MRLVKLTLFGLILASLAMMWTNRSYVTEAYEPTQDTLQVRLSGVDLAVTNSEIEPSPFLIPAAPDTKRATLPALSRPEPAELGPPPPVEMTDGKSRLNGVVSGPDGPVSGATVGIERQTSHGIGSLLVSTDEQGRWTAGRLPGGRYRVRAWVPGLMTTGGSEVRYVADEDSADIEFSMWGVDPTPALEFVHGGRIYDGLTGEVALALTRRHIDENGIVVTGPVPGALISVHVTSEVSIASSPVQLTDVTGTARFTLACNGSAQARGSGPTPDAATAPGTRTLTASSGDLVASFALPGCKPLPTPEPVVDDQAAAAPNPSVEGTSTNG